MDTINTIEFREETTQEDTSFNCPADVEEEPETRDSEMEEETNTQEEDCSQEAENEADSEEAEEESLDMEQIPLGTEKIMCERNGKMVEGEELVFVNPDTDLPVQTINELDSKDLDDEHDQSYNPEQAEESPSQQAEDEECEDSERESVDGEGLDGVMMKLGVNDHKKLVWADDNCRQEEDTNEEMNSAEDMDAEPCKTVPQEYDEEADPDFNPVYCGETLSDCDEDVEGEEEPVHQVLNLAGDTCIMKCSDMMIPTDTGIPVGPPAVEAEAPMDCE